MPDLLYNYFQTANFLRLNYCSYFVQVKSIELKRFVVLAFGSILRALGLV